MLTHDPLAFLTRVAKEYGDIALLRLGGNDLFFLSHPDLVREVLTVQRAKFDLSATRSRMELALGLGLITSRGELHARQRRLMQPVFRKSRIDSYARLMVEFSERQCEGWQPGGEIDVSEQMIKLTMKVAAKSLFDHDVAGDSDRVLRHLSTVMEFYTALMSPFLYLSLKLPLPLTLRFRRAIRELDELIYGMIEQRRAHPGGGADLLTLLMEAKDDQTNVYMNERQLRDEVITLFGAGQETMANALAWTIYLLAQHPDVQSKLHAEVSAALAGRPRLEAGDTARLAFARQVLLEALRLYPPAWFMTRRVLSEVRLGSYTLPEGTNVLVSQYVMHRDARSFDDPSSFRPERWTEPFMKSLHHGAYFPFGAGDRHCIGESFAWLEALLALSSLVARWRFEPAPGPPVRPKTSITLRPSTPIRARVHAR
jgi:cytochrome P450